MRDVLSTEMNNDSPPADPGSLYFTIQEELDFDQRYSEGCGFPDDHCEAWLRVNHPELLKAGATKYGSNTVTMKSSSVEVSPSPEEVGRVHVNTQEPLK